MKVKPKVVLTKEQVRELKFFCESVVGTRGDYYKLLDQFLAYKARIDRLNQFVKNVKKFLKDLGEDPEIHPLFKDMDELFK